MSTLTEFISSVKSEGLMGTSRFAVSIGIPPQITASKLNTSNLRKIILYCDSLTLPGINISTQPSKTFGEVREMPYEKLFDNVTFSFYVDNGMQVKKFFDNWVDVIQDPVTRKFNYYKEYIANIEISVYDIGNNQRYSVKLIECFPKSINPIQMDQSSKEVMRLQVSMNFRRWDSSIMDSTPTDDPLEQYI